MSAIPDIRYLLARLLDNIHKTKYILKSDIWVHTSYNGHNEKNYDGPDMCHVCLSLFT